MRLPVNPALPLAALILLGAPYGALAKSRPVAPPATSGPAADYPVVIGEPFTIDGRTWTPADTLNYDQVGHASLGTEAGSGVTAAHRTLPLPGYVEITSLESGRTILVRLERRGPMRNDRLVELSPAAAAQLGIMADNAPIRVRRVNPPEAERAMLRTGQQAPARMDTPQSLLGVLMRKLTGVPAAPLAAPPVAAASPAADAPPAARPKPQPKPGARSARVAPPAAAPTPTPTAPTPAPAAPAQAGASGSYVQAAAFSTKERADAAAAKLGATVSPAGRLWRMQLGPFAAPADAEAALRKARAAGYKDARIVRSR